MYKVASLTGHCGSYDHLLLEPIDEGEGEMKIGKVTMMVGPRSRHIKRWYGSSKGKYYQEKYAHFLIFKMNINTTENYHSKIAPCLLLQNTGILHFLFELKSQVSTIL